MTRLQAAGVMLVALGLIYALLYAGWLRRTRRHPSAAVVAREHDGGPVPDGSAVVAEGIYVSTTTARSRLERVAVAGLGNRSRATLTVRRGAPEELVTIEREGELDVVIPAPRLTAVRRDRGMAGKFMGANRILVLQWRADDGAVYETGFLPRYRADLERLESALWWHGGAPGERLVPDDHAVPDDRLVPDDHVAPDTSRPHHEGNPTA